MPSLTLPKRRLLALAVAMLALAPAGCSDHAGPGTPANDQGGALLSGDLNPGQGTFVLRRLDETLPDRAPIRVELIGSNLQVDAAAEVVSLDVAIRNAGEQPLFVSAMIWLYGLRPDSVTVLNADVVPGLPDTSVTLPPPPRERYGFDYTQFLGGDPVLAAGETSDARTWRFHVPGLTGFAFGARAEFGLVPDLPVIAGRCFLDANRDGVLQPGELPLPHGIIGATGPDGVALAVRPDQEGRYALPVGQAGLYTLQFWPFGLATVDTVLGDHEDGDDGDDGGDDPEDRPEPIFTTPNPLTVLLTPGPDGRPNSFLEANFGVFVAAEDDSFPPVVHTTAPFDFLHGDNFALMESGVTGSVMRLDVGFSGCQANHPFMLYWQEGPEMSPLPVAHLILRHDGRGEMCQAWFTRELTFDLRPILAALGGTQPIPLILHTPDGQIRSYVLRSPPIDGE
jgi:hypothetical protein